MDVDRLVHTPGLSMAKNWSPKVVLVGGTSSLVVDDSVSKTGPAAVDQEAVMTSQVGRCTPTETIVGQYRQLEQNPLPDRS